MYETGWGKKLNYVFAFATHGVADVVWRYSGTREETLSRRQQVPEAWLASVLHTINTQVWAGMPDDVHRRTLMQRYEDEKRTLWSDEAAGESRPLASQELMGRQTGDERWRRQRGELGDAAAATAAATAAAAATASTETAATTAAAGAVPSQGEAASAADVAPAADLKRAAAPTVGAEQANVANRSAAAQAVAEEAAEDLDEGNPFLALRAPCI